MNIGPAIFSILGSDSTLVAALGDEQKIYPLRAPQRSEFPYIVWNKISTQPNDTKDGVSTLDVIRVQFDFYHTEYDPLYITEQRVRELLDKYMGTVENISIDSCVFLTENETWEEEDDIYRISVDYSFRVKRNLPFISGINFLDSSHQLFSNHTGTDLEITGDVLLPNTNLNQTLKVYRDGILLFDGINFTISGNTIFLNIPAINENILVKFLPREFVQVNTINGASQFFTNVTDSILTITEATLPNEDFDENLEVYRDGILLLESVDFTVSENVITLTIPAVNQNFLVNFLPRNLVAVTPINGATESFLNVTGSTLTVTVASLPTENFEQNLEVYRDGILLLESVNFTVSGNVITLTLPAVNENFLVNFNPI